MKMHDHFDRLGRAADRALEAQHRITGATGPETVETVLAMIADTQAELARLSGLTENTLRALKGGKRPSAAQRAALCWAVFRRWS